MTINQQVFLKSRPAGIPQAEHFDIRDGVIPEIGEGEFLVRNHFLSADPAMRGWISDRSNYSPQIQLGETMPALAVGDVIESKNAEYPRGDLLMGIFGWQEYSAASGKNVILRVSDRTLPLSAYLGVVGMNGLAAYFGLLDVGAPKAGDTVVVSTAAGSVGSCAGQIAKIKGCRTVGIAGGPVKAQQCIEDFGFDLAIDYKSTNDLGAALIESCPDGVNVYYDNTSGIISDAVIRNIAPGARIVICGTAAYPSWNPWNLGPRPERHLLVKRARMQGFLTMDYADRFADALKDLVGWIHAGKIRYREEVLDGLAHAPGSLERLYSGKNMGKLVMRLPAAYG
jgi:NADPH-dependent curcumin reductase CurA